MRIAQIAPLHEAVPPKLYGGTERVVSYLTEELVELGHAVTLFASGDSVTKARLNSVWPQALRLDASVRDGLAPQFLLLEEVYRQADNFDILHFHLDYLPASLFSRQRVPFITTLHGRLDLPELQPVYARLPEQNLVSISDSQRLPLPQGNFIATVYHGLPLELLRPMPVTPPTQCRNRGAPGLQAGSRQSGDIAGANGFFENASRISVTSNSWCCCSCCRPSWTRRKVSSGARGSNRSIASSTWAR